MLIKQFSQKSVTFIEKSNSRIQAAPDALFHGQIKEWETILKKIAVGSCALYAVLLQLHLRYFYSNA